VFYERKRKDRNFEWMNEWMNVILNLVHVLLIRFKEY
jgi:hypothetical protein